MVLHGNALLTLVRKDLRLLFRDPVALVFLIVAPMVVISVAGFSLSSFYGGTGEASFLLPVVDLDDSEISQRLVAELERVKGLTLERLDEPSARRRVAEEGVAGAALIVPQGFGEALRRGSETELILLTDPVRHLQVLRIRAEVERARGALVTVRVAARVAVIELLTHAGDVDFEEVSEDARELAEELAGKAVSLRESSLTSVRIHFNTFDQNVPGFSTMFLMLGMLLGVSMGLLDERDWGMLYRVSASPVPLGVVVTGKVMSRFLVGVLQMVLLFLFGRWAFAVSLGSSLFALALSIMGVSFAGAAFGLLVASLAPSRDAVIPLGTIAVVAMTAMGGCWWPMSIEPQWLQRLAHLFPPAWAMQVFNDLMLRERSLSDVAGPLLALYGFGLVYLGAGAKLFLHRWEVTP